MFKILEIINTKKEKKKNQKNTKNSFLSMSVAYWWSMCFCAVLCVCLCAGHIVIVPLNLTCLHCLQHSFFEHLFNLYFHDNQFFKRTDYIKHVIEYDLINCISRNKGVQQTQHYAVLVYNAIHSILNGFLFCSCQIYKFACKYEPPIDIDI